MTTDDDRSTRTRDARAFTLGQAVSCAGDAFSRVALPLLVLRATGSLAQMGALSACVATSWLAAGLVSGRVVDRHDRRRVLLACDLTQGVACASVPAVWWSCGPSLPWLYAVASTCAVAANLHRAAASAAVQALTPPEGLMRANARLHAAEAIAGCVCPVAAGAVCLRFGPAAAVGVDALSFFAAAAATRAVRATLNPPVSPRPGTAWHDLREGARFVAGQPVLRDTLALATLAALLLAGRNDITVFLARRAAGDLGVGATLAAASAGSLMGALSAQRLRARWGFAACWMGATAVMGATLVGLGASSGFAALALAAAVLAAAETVRGINTITLRQERAPAHLLGRVTAVWWTVLEAPNALGARVTPYLAERLGATPTLRASGLALLTLMTLAAARAASASRTPETT